MKKLLRSTFGTLVVAAFLAIAPPMYARGGHGGGHGGHRDGHSGHGGGHAARLMFEEETMALVFAGGVVTTLLGRRAAMRAMQGANIMPLAAAAGELTGQIRTTNIRVTAWAIMAWAIAIHTTVLAITVTAPVGATIRITDIVPADIILTDADIGHI